MGRSLFKFLLFICAICCTGANQCAMDGVTSWLVPESINILDIDREAEIFKRATQNIEEITDVTYTEGLNGGPYLSFALENSEFIISTNIAFNTYENYETSLAIGATVLFRCASGTSSIFVITVNIQDTNNHSPEFEPFDSYEFTIAPPVPPGFLVTDCINDIIARDIDLTTTRVDFEIEGSSLFEISYDGSSSVPKEFKATLRSVTFIRSIPEPIILRISATDVDQTDDPPRTTVGTITINANNEFEFPDEPIFSQAFYLATYADNEIELQDTIYLRQGFDDQTTFTFDGTYKGYFQLYTNNNEVSFQVLSPIPVENIPDDQIYLVVSAEREYTSGDTATVIVQLPRARELKFEESAYSGTLEDNIITINSIVLNIDNDATIELKLSGDYSEYFSVENTNNQIFINVNSSLPDSAIIQNDYIMLTLSASASNAVPAYTAIFLNIIKEDLLTPIFNRNIYRGKYIDTYNIELEDILVTQGLDETVTFEIEQEYEEYIQIYKVENGINLVLSSPIPEALIFENKVLVFSILAQKPRTVGANAAVSISFPDELIQSSVLVFSKNTYYGQLDDNLLTVENIILESGYTSDTQFVLIGEYEPYFRISNDINIITVVMAPNASYEDLLMNKFIIIEIEASREMTIPATSTIVIDVVSYVNTTTSIMFDNTYYSGSLLEQNVLEFTEIISLRHGFDETVEFNLEGDNNEWFTLFQISSNSMQVVLKTDISIPEELIQENVNFIFTIVASKSETNRAQATIIIELPRDVSMPTVLMFSKSNYNGRLEDNLLTVESIILDSGYTADTEFVLNGEFEANFNIANNDNVIVLTMATNADSEDLLYNKFIVLEIEASRENAITATSVVIIDIVSYINTTTYLEFENAYYTGSLIEQNALEFTGIISLRYGFDETVEFNLEGDDNEWFILVRTGSNSIIVALNSETTIPEEVIEQSTNLIFKIVANKPDANRGQAVIIINIQKDFNRMGRRCPCSSRSVLDVSSNGSAVLAFIGRPMFSIRWIKAADDYSESIRFMQNYYTGYFEKSTVTLDWIVLENFPSGVTLDLIGDYSNYFQVYTENEMIGITQRDNVEIDFQTNVLVFTLQATTVTSKAHTIIVLEIIQNGTDLSILKFSEPFYLVLFTESKELIHDSEIILINGYDESVRFSLEGDGTEWFSVNNSRNPVELVLSSELPSDVIENNNYLVLVIRASNSDNITAEATIIIEIMSAEVHNFSAENRTSFNKVFYTGYLQESVVTHESIILSNYNGSNIVLSGDYADLFNANILNGLVTIISTTTITIPDSIAYIPLQLNADEANAVLLLDVIPSEEIVLPKVTFSSSLYTIRTDVTQTGVIGRVAATADNNEPITYSLLLEDDHLRERVSVNNDGDISLSAPASSGTYSFEVIATTIVNRVSARATVSLWVDAITMCETDIVVPPLIVIERLEEEAYRDLVLLNQTQHGCRYQLTNHWPIDQNWLYVDDEGLHTESIDREHESIAFMPVSQVQVELVLYCEEDMSRTKRSLDSSLGPYDYGAKSWILTETILYNSRRSLVNLIVIDINDNAPIFVGKEIEPIYIGYPIHELEDIILPRSLVELRATDADIGDNAAIIFWSAEDNLAVASTTGYVHVRDSALLVDDSRFTIYAIDQNGRGLNGSIEIIVKLLDENHIAVLTIRDAFLDDEETVIKEISSALGYDIKVLKAAVVSDTDTQLRRKRETTSTGVSLQLYLYGINQNNPVSVNQLTSDISNNNVVTVNIARILSLEDHLESLEICIDPGRETALLASTISLAVLLFILITAIAIWFFLKWRRESKYNQFSDVNSLASRESSLQKIPKVVNPVRTRLDREELKKSEKRLQDMLNEDIREPVEQIQPQEMETEKEQDTPKESIIDISEPEHQLPIVIQSIDKLKDAHDDSDNDEFGEIKNNRRKSVVTFNENVEKIIHIEDRSDSVSSDSEFEVYKF